MLTVYSIYGIIGIGIHRVNIKLILYAYPARNVTSQYMSLSRGRGARKVLSTLNGERSFFPSHENDWRCVARSEIRRMVATVV